MDRIKNKNKKHLTITSNNQNPKIKIQKSPIKNLDLKTRSKNNTQRSISQTQDAKQIDPKKEI